MRDSIEGVDAWLEANRSALAETAEKTPNISRILRPRRFVPSHNQARRRCAPSWMRSEARVEMVITSVGLAGRGAWSAARRWNYRVCRCRNDPHAEKAIASGVDGLIFVDCGRRRSDRMAQSAGVRQGNPRDVRWTDRLAGGISTARRCGPPKILGCDLAYMGTKFIATNESKAAPAYKQMWCVPV